MHPATPNAAYLWLIPLFPLLGAMVNAFLGKRLAAMTSERVNGWIAVAFMAPTFVIGVYAFFELLGLPEEARYLLDHRWTILDVGVLKVAMAFWIDPLSGIMLLVVTGVGTLIHIYSTGYMHGDRYGANWRFFAYLNLFIFFMLLLILGDNFILMFFGWEGVGLCSFLLISFYYKDTEMKGEPPALPPAASGSKAFIVNRIGDFGFIIGLFCLFWGLGGSWDAGGYGALDGGGNFSVTFRDISATLADPAVRSHLLTHTFMGMSLVTAACVFFFVGATGKSAQFPLYVWLPDAMAGPTPVSALIHAATMVTAGVYMIARLNFLYALSPAAMTLVATTGALTALFAATIGFFQWDIKKVLAYSTVSQLGFMFMGVGVGAFAAGIFHLVTHAFFKACLFLASGSVIHGMHHEQDMRYMGGLRKRMPITFWTYLIATFAIAGFPLTAGFFSKDEILWGVFNNGNTLIHGGILWIIGVLAAGGTSFYMMRTVGMTFSGELRGNPNAHGHGDDDHAHEPHESPWSMVGVLCILAGLALVAGFVGVPEALGGHNHFHHFLEPVIPAYATEALKTRAYGHSVEWTLMGFTVLVGMGGLYIGYKMYWNRYQPTEWIARWSPKAFDLVLHKYRIDEVYDRCVRNPLLGACANVARFDTNVVDGTVNLVGGVTRLVGHLDAWIDTNIVDGAVNGIGDVATAFATRLKQAQSGRIQHYTYGVVAGVVVLLVFYQFA